MKRYKTYTLDTTHYVKIQDKVFMDSNSIAKLYQDVGYSGYLLFTFLATMTDSNGVAKTNMTDIAAKTGVPYMTVRRVIERLKQHNYLTIT